MCSALGDGCKNVNMCLVGSSSILEYIFINQRFALHGVSLK